MAESEFVAEIGGGINYLSILKSVSNVLLQVLEIRCNPFSGNEFRSSPVGLQGPSLGRDAVQLTVQGLVSLLNT